MSSKFCDICSPARYGQASFAMNETTFLWIIKDVRTSPIYIGKTLRSSTFPLNARASTRWYISLSLDPYAKGLKACIYLEKNDSMRNIEATITLSLLNAAFQVEAEKQMNMKFTHKDEFHSICLIHNVTRLRGKRAATAHGDIVLYCRISPCGGSEPKSNNCGTPTSGALAESLVSIRKEGLFSDFLVQVENMQFFCHKFLLACRSEYFSAMLKHDMKEANENKLVLEDLKPHLFEQIIVYLYTGHVDVSEADVFELYLAADRFQLERLKGVCEMRMHSLLCVENATKIFTFASIYNIQLLKKNAFNFIDAFLDKAILVDMEYPFSIANPKALNNIENEHLEEESTVVQLPVIKMLNPDKLTAARRKSPIGSKRTFVPKADFWCYTVKQVLSSSTVFVVKELESISVEKVLCTHLIHSKDATWRIEICTVTKNFTTNFLCMRMHLMIEKDEHTSFSMEYNVAIHDVKKRKAKNFIGVCHCEMQKYSEVCFMLVDDILANEDLFHKQEVRLYCSFTEWKSVVHNYVTPSIPKCDLADDLKSALEEQTFTDVVVKVQGETFSCHKAILACNMPFFDSKFQEITCTDTIVIDDMEPNAFKKILSSFYTGMCEFTESEIENLLLVCDKYSLLSIRSNFLEVWSSTLRIDNSAEILLFADRYNADNMKNRALEFIGRNMEKVIKTQGWSLVASHESLISLCFKVYALSE